MPDGISRPKEVVRPPCSFSFAANGLVEFLCMVGGCHDLNSAVA
jgi:hypothetical protein